jgi:thiol-disulfide isomerase/thioredoxin
MAERFLLVLVLAILIVVGTYALRRWNARRIARIGQEAPDWRTLGAEPDGRRTVIAFSTPSCAACHAAQSPAIQVARATVGEPSVRLIDVDAARQPEVARAFGVLTVPSTVVIAARGTRIVAVNQGFTPSSRLVEQLQQS